MDTLLPSHPSSYSRLIKRSVRLYRISFKNIILLSVLLSFTAFIPRLFSYVIGQDIFLNLSPFSPYRLWLVAVEIICLIFFIGIIWRMHCFIINKHEPLAEDLFIGLKKVLYVFIAAVLQSGIVFAVTIIMFGLQILLQNNGLLFNPDWMSIVLTLLVFVGQLALILYFSTLFIFLVPLITIEDKGIVSALKRSAFLVWNHWWRVFSVQITPWLTLFFLLALIRFVLRIDIHIYFVGQGAYSLWISLFQLVMFALYIPWVAALLLVQLKDLELRKHLITQL